MRRICTLSALLAFASALAIADTWQGQLFDANCVEQHKTDKTYDACAPSMETTMFSVQISGHVLILDEDGNKKAAAAWKQYNNTADRAKDPNAPATLVVAIIQGDMNADGDAIKIDSIKLQ